MYRRQMASTWLPEDRRSLTLYDTDHSLYHLVTVCQQLELFGQIDLFKMRSLADKLYKLVMRRHTHLWDKTS